MKLSVDKWTNQIGVSSWASKLISLFLLTDVCFLMLSIIAISGRWSFLYPDIYTNPYFVEADRGYAEFFQYMKLLWCILLLGLIVIKRRSPLYLSWMLLFLYLLADDYAEIHEKWGLRLSNMLGFLPMIGLRAKDFGELLISTSAGLILLTCIGVAYRLGDSVFRKMSKTLIVMLLALAVCGIVLDMLHIMIGGITTREDLDYVFGLLEDGGEMIVMSAVVTFIFVKSEQITSGHKS